MAACIAERLRKRYKSQFDTSFSGGTDFANDRAWQAVGDEVLIWDMERKRESQPEKTPGRIAHDAFYVRMYGRGQSANDDMWNSCDGAAKASWEKAAQAAIYNAYKEKGI